MKIISEITHFDLDGNDNGLYLKVIVKDTGMGMKEDKLESLFQNFGYIDDINGQKLNPNGVGLGLSISKKIVEMFGG